MSVPHLARPRRSTFVLLAVFLVALVTYGFVRPLPEDAEGTPRSGTPAVVVEPTPAPTATPTPEPVPSPTPVPSPDVVETPDPAEPDDEPAEETPTAPTTEETSGSADTSALPQDPSEGSPGDAEAPATGAATPGP